MFFEPPPSLRHKNLPWRNLWLIINWLRCIYNS